MKFKNRRLAGSISRDGQDVADRIIVIPDRIASAGHRTNKSPKFIVAIGDRAADRLP
jgi:hypothetical protein